MFTLKLVELSCGNPGEVTGATKSGGYEFGDIVTYNCSPGYQLTSGDTSLQCQANQQWLGSKPTCKSNNLSKIIYHKLIYQKLIN